MRNLKTHPDGESYYDLFDDWDLIESSFLKQYGIRLRTENDMSYQEFCSLLSGIMPDTPLGQIVSIRAEKDKEVLKHFTPEQRRIRSEWRNRKWSSKSVKKKTGNQMLLNFQMEFKNAFSKKK